jgi:hypothetical protein
VSAEVRHIKKDSRVREISVSGLGGCATLAEQNGKRGAENDPRALWMVILQALAMVTSAIRKYVGAKGSCETCGRVL